eukprot:scaffold4836_cov127-Isochrysis_galbana.AAC.8
MARCNAVSSCGGKVALKASVCLRGGSAVNSLYRKGGGGKSARVGGDEGGVWEADESGGGAGCGGGCGRGVEGSGGTVEWQDRAGGTCARVGWARNKRRGGADAHHSASG